ncbi:MAG: hypothetical protein IJ163_05410 [Bacteroidaceae bacterium]|nr:hypothetical protein [Bacteroidaceae bacterium]
MKQRIERYLLTALLCLTAMAVNAQTTVIDKEENFPVSYASVFNQDGKFLGQTDVNGILPDIQDAKSIRITHIAYEPLQVKKSNLGKEIKMQQVQLKLNEAVIAKPKSHCIKLTGFLRNYVLTNQLYEDDDPVHRFYEGTGNLYIFLNGKNNSKWYDLAARDGKTGRMVDEQKDVMLSLRSKSAIERLNDHKDFKLRQAEGYKQIVRNDTTVGTVVTDPADSIIRVDIDHLFPDTVRVINLLIAKFRVTAAKQNFIYQQPNEEFVSQSNLLAYNIYMRYWTKLLGTRFEGDHFLEFRVDKAQFLTEDEYKADIKAYKADKKSGKFDLTSEQLDSYMKEHNIPEIPEELKKSLEISRQIQAREAEKKEAKKNKNKEPEL